MKVTRGTNRQQLELECYLIVDINNHALWKNQKIHKPVGNVSKLAGEARVSVTRSIVAAQLCPYNTACT